MTERALVEPMQCAILAGGLATRMRPLTETIPKALLPVAGRPFAWWQLRWLADQGVSDVVYCVAHMGEQIRDYVGDGDTWGLRVRYADEGTSLRGTAGALADAARAGMLEDEFLVLYGDSYLDVSVSRLWQEFERSGHPMLLSVFHNGGAYDRSNVRFANGMVELYAKNVEEPSSVGLHHIDYGLSAMRTDALLAEVPQGPDPVDLATLQHRFSVQGRLAGFEVFERFYEIGSPEGLVELEAFLGSSEMD
ncbi:MAG: sugar phosphate nucleotidyltransferase [Acidimicrobiales bacterium]